MAGRILACEWVRFSCQRHIDDLARSKDGWRFVFDEGKANHKCRFIESLPHTKGDWASRGEKIHLEPWQCFIICSIFGWIDRETRFRRFREAYLAVPRKNAKSTLAAGIGIAMFCADGEFGAEVYSGATTEKQAWEVFRPARLMVKNTPDLAEAFGITVGAKQMFIEANGSRFEPLIGKPGDGASPHCAIIDEYHEHETAVSYDTMKTGQGARKQPLLLVITTAGDNLGGPCKALQEDLEKVLNGSIERDELFGMAWTIDDADDWTTDEALRKANPNYDVSVFGDFLRTQITNAVQNAAKQGITKTKHLNVWVGSVNAAINVQKWIALGDRSLSEENFVGLPCAMGIDLSSKRDFTARAVVFKKILSDGKPHYYVFCRLYVPEARIKEPDRQSYQKWAHEKAIIPTDGERIDYELFEGECKNDIIRFKPKQVAADDWNAEALIQSITKMGKTTVVELSQGGYQLSDPTKELIALVDDGRIHHDGNPALTWMIGNLTARTESGGDRIKPVKTRDENKIDGPIAVIMALSRVVHMDAVAQKSVYASRGLRTL